MYFVVFLTAVMMAFGVQAGSSVESRGGHCTENCTLAKLGQERLNQLGDSTLSHDKAVDLYNETCSAETYYRRGAGNVYWCRTECRGAGGLKTKLFNRQRAEKVQEYVNALYDACDSLKERLLAFSDVQVKGGMKRDAWTRNQSSTKGEPDTVTDHGGNLEWQRTGGEGDDRMKWEEGKDHCARLTLHGKNDWRMPRAQDWQNFHPKWAHLTSQPLFMNGDYWTSTRDGERAYAFQVHSSDTGMGHGSKAEKLSDKKWVRCVRDYSGPAGKEILTPEDVLQYKRK